VKHFHEVLAGTVHECSLRLSIGRVSVVSWIVGFSILIPLCSIHAEIVVLGKRFFIDRTNIRGQLYSTGPQEGDKIHVQIVSGNSSMSPNGIFVGAYTLEFNCNDKFDWEKVEKAANSISQHIK
jgi:hypothetical protein